MGIQQNDEAANRRVRTLDELREYAKARGYKVAWADHVWNQRHRLEKSKARKPQPVPGNREPRE